MTDRKAEMVSELESLRAELATYKAGAVPCQRCGGPAPEFVVPNDAWNTIIRDDGPERPGEYLCLTCFANDAASKIRHLVAALHIAAGQIENLGGRPMFDKGRVPGDRAGLLEELGRLRETTRAAIDLKAELSRLVLSLDNAESGAAEMEQATAEIERLRAAVLAGARYSDALMRLQKKGAPRGKFTRGTAELDRLFMDFHDKAHAAIKPL